MKGMALRDGGGGRQWCLEAEETLYGATMVDTCWHSHTLPDAHRLNAPSVDHEPLGNIVLLQVCSSYLAREGTELQRIL